MGTALIRRLADAGLTVRAEGRALVVEPGSLITDPLRQFIRQHKSELLEELRKNQPEPQQALCLTCQHYRFGHDHMGNVARCMASGGFRGALIERPEQRRECGDYVLYDDPDRT